MAVPELAQIEGKYEILAKLREGGMGAVYKVRHRLLEEVRVVKVIRPQFESDEELRLRFLREARSAVRLRHPNIAQIYDFTVDEDGTSYMVMEFIDGRDLAELLRMRGFLSVGLVLEVGVQCLKALSYLHRNHFVHRDISPDNVMLTQDVEGEPLVKLIDLGIAKQLKGSLNLTAEGSFLGKIRYASPEHFGGRSGEVPLDHRSDLYSLGIVLYELLTGSHPITGTTHESLLAGHLFHAPRSFGETDPDSRVPPELREAILRCLEKEPGARFTDANDVYATLNAIRQQWEEPEPEQTQLERTLLRPREIAEETEEGITQADLDEFAPSAAPRAEESDPQELLAELRQRVDALLEEGRLEEAENAVERSASAIGQELLEPLAGRLRELREGVDELLEESRRLLARGDLKAAVATLEKLRDIEPSNRDLAALEAKIETAHERRRRQAEEARALIRDRLEEARLDDAQQALEEAIGIHGRTEAFADLERKLREVRAAAEAKAGAIIEIADRVRGLLQESRLSSARGEIERAELRFGRAPLVDELREQLETRRGQAERHLERARELGDRGELEAAADELRRALALDCEDPGGLALRSELDLSSERRRTALAETRALVEAYLKAGEIDEASEGLERALAELGTVDVLLELRERIEQARNAAESQQRSLEGAAALIEVLLAEGRLDEAEEALGTARAVHGDSKRLAALERQLREARGQRREQEERERSEQERERRRQVAGLLEEARRRAAAEQHEDAFAALRKARQIDPDNPAITTLIETIEAERERSAARPAAEAGAPYSAPPAAPRRRAILGAGLGLAALLMVVTVIFWPDRVPGGGRTTEGGGPSQATELTAEEVREGLVGVELGSYHALIVGNNEYREGFTFLESAVGDAQALAGLLESRFGFTVELLLDATRYEMLAALEDLTDRLGEGDNVLVFYAGHGYVDENGRGYWQPVDAELSSTANWISSVDVADLLLDLQARRALVISDSCFSGAFLEDAEEPVALQNADHVREVASRRSRLAVTSGALAPVADSDGSGHSIFASALLTALGEASVLDAGSLFEEIRGRIEGGGRGDSGMEVQTPQFGPLRSDGGGSFFFVEPA